MIFTRRSERIVISRCVPPMHTSIFQCTPINKCESLGNRISHSCTKKFLVVMTHPQNKSTCAEIGVSLKQKRLSLFHRFCNVPRRKLLFARLCLFRFADKRRERQLEISTFPLDHMNTRVYPFSFRAETLNVDNTRVCKSLRNWLKIHVLPLQADPSLRWT